MSKLAECMALQAGVIAFVGGGGKTSTIYTLAKELYGLGKKVIVTTTTKMYLPTLDEVEQILLAPTPLEVQEALAVKGLIAVARETLGEKMLGVSEQMIRDMQGLADYVLVEADGSKHLPIKVPAQHEPVIPSTAQQVVIVVGMRAFGKRLKEVCFRVEETMEFLDVDETHRLGIEEMARMITDSKGLKKGVEARSVRVLLNQIDELSDINEAYGLSQRVKQLGIEEVILAAIKQQKWHKG